MKQSRSLPLLALTAIVLTIFACTKTGPIGATGATGPTGSKGDSGATGAKGDTGVANVQYSQWTDIAWTKDPSGSATSNLIVAKGITNQILDSGFVLVYMRPDSVTNSPFLLPYTQLISGSATFVIQSVFQAGGGGITIQSSTPIGGVPLGAADFYPNAQIRYVAVPPGVAIPSNISYEKISKMLNMEN